MMKHRKVSTAYAAGIFDGEGTIGIYRSGTGYWSVKLTILGIYKPMILALYRTFNVGSIGTQKRQELARTPSQNYEPRLCRQGWRWMITNRADIARFIKLVRSYLMEKRKQAEIVMAFIKGKLSGSKASRLCKKAKRFEFGGPERLIGPRALKGEENPTSKLTADKVETIRHEFDTGISMCKLAKRHKLGETHVHRIIKNEAWKHVPYRCSRPVLTTAQLGDKHPTARLKESDVRAIRRRLATGDTQSELAKRFDIAQSQISLIASGKAWRCVR